MGSEDIEADRRQVIEALRRHRPELDPDQVISGLLAGPADEHRPDFPVWDYGDHLDDPDWSGSPGLERVRFPILATTGETLIMSLSELMDPLAAPSQDGTAGRPRKVGFKDAVRLYRIMHDLGALRWDENTRTHVEVIPHQEYFTEAFAAWVRSMEQ